MRKIAVILFLVFAAVQVAPAVCSFFSPSTSVFMVDEEKGEDKNESEKKSKKDYAAFASYTTEFSHKLNTAFLLAEKIQPSPCLEKLTPPPNFC